MNKTRLILLTGVLLLSACSSAQLDKSTPQTETGYSQKEIQDYEEQKDEINLPSGGTVNFEGVSFSYNPQALGTVKAEKMLKDQAMEDETEKPHENFPRHIEFRFEKNSLNKGRIAIVPIAEHRKMYAVSEGMIKAFDEGHRDLQKVLKDKNFRVKSEIPFIPFYDAHQAIVAQVKQIPFQNGKSICFLTQYEQEATIINNEDTAYYCQGVTANNKNYFLARFSARISFLPDGYTDEFEGYKLSYKNWNEKQYENYISIITKRINALAPDEFEPSLNELENLIASLKIEK